MAEAVTKCVHCGFCLAACPSYRELGSESESPRGRIVIMKEVLEGTLTVADASPHVDACLGCLACEPACPSGVPYRDLISAYRAQTNPERNRSWGEKLRRKLVTSTLPYPKRFKLAAMTGRLAKPLAPLLPSSLSVMLDLLPAESVPSAAPLPGVIPAEGKTRGRVALLLGCAQQVLDPDINTATIEVLVRNGIEVVIPPSQGCCGALSWHVGEMEDAQRFARRNRMRIGNSRVSAHLKRDARRSGGKIPRRTHVRYLGLSESTGGTDSDPQFRSDPKGGLP